MIRSVAVQVVLYGNDARRLVGLAGAVRAVVAHARRHLDLDAVAVRLGDSSPTPCLDGEDVGRLRSALGDVPLTYEFFDANLGSGGGSNALAACGDEEAIWVLNPDTYPAPSAMSELLNALGGDDVAIAEARQIPIEHPKAYDPTTGDTPWASGFSMIVRRSVFDGVGGFDAQFFPMYCDDVDLSWRVRAAGWRVVHVPTAVVLHDKPIESGGAIRWSHDEARWSHLARLWLYRKYGRPDLEAAFLASIDDGSDPVAADAAAEFRRRTGSGESPEPFDGARRVALFDSGRYAPHRFEYSA